MARSLTDIATPRPAARQPRAGIAKTPTGIQGLDEILGGGLPTGRPTLVCGSAGAGKTMLSVEFLVHGAMDHGEPGVFMMFEEDAGELTANVRSLGFDLDELVAANKIRLDHVHIERSEIEETGEYDLEGLFIRLGHAVDSIGAKRVVLDTLEALFSGLPNHAILRAELRRLFRWLKDRGLTAVITGERGEHSLTRYGLEEYVADCVIVLDHRVTEQVSTRRLRVMKYRGSAHGTNEFPFLIGSHGLSVLPITSLGLDHEVSDERMSTGIADLDEMLGGQGIYRGSSVLITGTPGTGKTSLVATFLSAACGRGERCLMFAFEESPAQIVRNMRSVGIDLQPCIDSGLLHVMAARPTLQGLEQHLLTMHDAVLELRPSIVAVDPISNLTLRTSELEVKPTLMRLIDFLKLQQVTAVFTSLTAGGAALEDTQIGVSSLMDTWLLVRAVEENGERNRTLYVLKSRGVANSNQVREFLLTEHGVALVDPYLGSDRVVTGTARLVQEARERAAAEARRHELDRHRLDLDARRTALEAQMAALRVQIEALGAEAERTVAQETLEREMARQEAQARARGRGRASTNGGAPASSSAPEGGPGR